MLLKKFTNNKIMVTKPTGCWNCKHLDYYEKDSYESLGENGWMCEANDNSESFKDFPCKRKLKCFESKPIANFGGCK